MVKLINSKHCIQTGLISFNLFWNFSIEAGQPWRWNLGQFKGFNGSTSTSTHTWISEIKCRLLTKYYSISDITV